MKLNKSWIALLLLVMAQGPTLNVYAQQQSVTSTPILKTSESWNGAPVHYPAGTPEISAFIVEVAPGAQTGWHSHPVPSFGMILEGELEVELKDGRKNVLKAGDAVVEVVDALHNGINKGARPMKLVVFYAGVKEQPLTVTQGAAVPGK